MSDTCKCVKTAMKFGEAKRAVRKLKLRSVQGYVGLRMSKKLPCGLPERPQIAYAKQWKGWKDYLGVK